MTTTPTRQLRVYGNHGRDHWFPGNTYQDCAGCAPWLTPATTATRDQAFAARRDDDRSGARAVGTALTILAVVLTAATGLWSLYAALTNLGDVHAWHVAWFPLLATTAWLTHRLWKDGQNR